MDLALPNLGAGMACTVLGWVGFVCRQLPGILRSLGQGVAYENAVEAVWEAHSLVVVAEEAGMHCIVAGLEAAVVDLVKW